MNDPEKYFFDINGYVILNDVLSPDEIALANEAIDHHADGIRERVEEFSLSGESKTMTGTTGRGDLGGMLSWEKPWCEPFRAMLVHPRIVPYLNTIVGQGFRMDHNCGLITMHEGAEGHILHGSSGPGFDPNQYYIFKDGRMHNGLTVVAWQLADVNEGDGGLCVIPGSHKGNYPCPQEVRQWEMYQEIVKPITCRAGDVVIFTEATTHGTLPWRAKHERRSLLFRYTAGNLAYATGYNPWPEELLDGLTPEQRAVLEPPYHNRLQRPLLDDSARLVGG
ncbi:MAG: phytanoyl-CoA dioxygenase family protein [Candidatus Latescibacterota bacterium]|nr:phytanoyl-CoA dioxygenase family protein [Candidatus Latescibacterota bacterium]